MRILALDYGRVHTGTAISDPTGTVARPLEDVSDVTTEAGLEKIAAIARREGAARVVVGMPVSLSGETGPQARETGRFLESLRRLLDIPVSSWDERFTSKLAAEKERDSSSSSHSLAACYLLENFLASRQYKSMAADEGRGEGGRR
ncbi:putative Holliday junction resolvase [bacterium BMS3Abin01]|nr:putative Holliday junction resolvase [bacterium BMS3Abin01]